MPESSPPVAGRTEDGIGSPGRIPPALKGNWLTGSLGDFRRDMLGFYERCFREHGDCVEFRLGLNRLCLMSHPDLIECVLTTGSRFFSKRTYVLDLLVPVLGNGLLTSEGDFWLRQRRLAQPGFQRQRVASFGDAMVAYTQRMLEGWKDGETRDLHADMMRLTLQIVAKTLFDADVAGDAPEVGAALEVVMDNFITRWESFWPMPPWVPTPANLRFRRAIRQLDAVIYRLIAERRGEERDDLLSRLLHARDEVDGSGMTDRQLRDEVMTLFLAGHETTANALSWTWYLLGRHPEVEARLAAEQETALGGRPPRVDDVQRLVYTESVFLESMRLYPPVYAFGRVALQDCDVGAFRIRKGTTVIFSQWITHRDARFFDEPLAFKPERWLDGLAKRLHRYAYFPFGGGPRICIGNHFAMMEGILILATMAAKTHFTLLPGHPVVPRTVVTLRPDPGIMVVVKKK